MTQGKPGSARHGTMSGYVRHLRRGEKPCGPGRAHSQDWRRARGLRERSGYQLTMAEALAELGLPQNRVPAEVTP